jgi:hypothetical protein
MPKYLLKWQFNPLTVPSDPEQRFKLWMGLIEGVKGGLKAGEMKDWGVFADMSGGYAIRESDENSLMGAVLQFSPYIIFDAKPVLSVDQCTEIIKCSSAPARPE